MKIKVVYQEGFKNYPNEKSLIYDNLNSEQINGIITGSILKNSEKEEGILFYDITDSDEGKEIHDTSSQYILGFFDYSMEDLNGGINPELTERLVVKDEGSIHMYIQFNTFDFLEGFRTALYLFDPEANLEDFTIEKNIPFTSSPLTQAL